MSGIKISSRNIPKGNLQGERRGEGSPARVFSRWRVKKKKKKRRVHVASTSLKRSANRKTFGGNNYFSFVSSYRYLTSIIDPRKSEVIPSKQRVNIPTV